MVLVTKPKRTNSIKHQKRYGQHHKQTKPYLKPYWPYLPILAIIILGFVVNAVWMRPSHSVLGYASDISETNLLNDTNEARQSSSEPALNLNDKLVAAAQAKADDMARENFWSHVTPAGEQPWVFIKDAGYNYNSAGENLAYGFSTSASTLAGWMNSPDHRANILNKNYKDVGFGIANATNFVGNGPETIVVAMYAQPAGTTPAVSPAQTISPIFTVAGSSSSQPIQPISSSNVSRLQTFAGGNSSYVMLVLAFLAGAGSVVLIFKHALAWRRVFAKGEKFIIHHPWLDVFIVFVIAGSIIVSQTAGNIL